MAAQGVFATIYRIAALVPRGKIATYGQIARIAGLQNGARVVGWAMMACGGAVPAHRVIKADGGLCKDHEWEHIQRQLLLEEGVLFCKNGKVDMAQCQWNPTEDALSEL